jgi:phosphohistidine phosphatase SixA
MTLEEEAIALLLRSPRLEVGTIIDLLDVSDGAFRAMVGHNPRIAALLEARRAGVLAQPNAEPTQCPACNDWFLPYASARFCSDACRDMGRLQTHRVKRSRSMGF